MHPQMFVILGQRHGSNKLEQIGGLIPAPEARDTFLPYREKTSDPDFQRVWLMRLENEWDMRLADSNLAPVAPEKPATPPTDSTSSTQDQSGASKKRK